jgi:hypothetical protein
MKRFLTALLAILYLSLSSGASVHAHYCMGKLIGTTLSHAATEDGGEHSCDLCGMKKDSNGGCCHDEEATFKVSEAQQSFASISLTLPSIIADLPIVFHAGQSRSFALRPQASLIGPNGPPKRPPACPIYVQVCNFRI